MTAAEIEVYIENHFPVNEANSSEVLKDIYGTLDELQQLDDSYLVQCYLMLGEAWKFQNKLPEAINALNEGIAQLKSRTSFGYSMLSNLYHNLGIYYAQINQMQECRNAFMQHIYYGLIDNNKYGNFDFYSFRSPSSFSIDDLANNTITVVSPKEFNDPVDCLLFPWLDYQRKISANTEGEKRAAEALIDVYNHIKVRCFVRNTALPTKEEDNPKPRITVPEPCHLLMWAHYASSHTGFCVHYTLPYDLTDPNPNIPEVSRLGNVNYDSDASIKDSMNVQDAYFKKSKDWEYENEVRLLHFDPTWGTNYKPIKLPAGCVKEVFFGIKATEETKQKIRDALRNQNVDFYQMDYQPDKVYRLTYSKV